VAIHVNTFATYSFKMIEKLFFCRWIGALVDDAKAGMGLL